MAHLQEARRKNPKTGKIESYFRIIHSQHGSRTSMALGFIPKAEAKRLLTVFEGKIAGGVEMRRFTEPSSTTVADALDRLLESLAVRGIASSTQRQAAHCAEALRRHLAKLALVQLLPVRAETPPLERYVLQRRDEGVRNRTIQIELRYLRQACELVGEKCPAIPRLSLDDSRPPRWFTPAQRLQFAEALPWSSEPASALAVYALLLLGARKSEVLALRWDSVLWHLGNHGALRFGATLVESEVRGHTKTRRERVVPMPSDLATALKAEHQRQGAPSSGWVFPSEQGSSHLRDVRRTIRGACQRAGLPLIHPHGLRHSMATAAAASGVPRRVTQDIGGWVDPRSLDRVYTHSIEGATIEAIERLSLPQSTQPEHSALKFPAGESTAADEGGGGKPTNGNRGGGI